MTGFDYLFEVLEISEIDCSKPQKFKTSLRVGKNQCNLSEPSIRFLFFNFLALGTLILDEKR